MELSSCKGKSPLPPPPVNPLPPPAFSSSSSNRAGKGEGGGEDDGRGHEIIGILSRRILCASSFNWLRDFSIPICTRLHAGKNVCIRARARACVRARVHVCVCVCVRARDIRGEADGMATTSLNFFRDGRDALLVFPSVQPLSAPRRGWVLFFGVAQPGEIINY